MGGGGLPAFLALSGHSVLLDTSGSTSSFIFSTGRFKGQNTRAAEQTGVFLVTGALYCFCFMGTTREERKEGDAENDMR